MKKLTIKEAEKLMRKYLKNVPDKIKHSILVSKFAYQAAKKIKKKHPGSDIDLKEVRIIGLLHDIGKGRYEKGKSHIFAGGNILKELGFDSYAKKIEKHGAADEQAEYYKIKGNFRPTLIEEKILVYADSHFDGDRFVEPEERFRLDDIKGKKKHPEKSKFYKKSISRRMKIIREIDNLLK